MEYIIGLLIGFLIGCLWTRIYYSQLTARTDWMRSWDWFSGRWWNWLHKWMCEYCPKKRYCLRYEEKKLYERNR